MTETIKTLLEDAARMIEEASVPDDLREVAFSKAVELLAAERASASPGTSIVAIERQDSAASDWMAALEAGTRRTRDELEDVFFLGREGQPRLGIDPIRLGSNAAERSRKAMLLLAGARQIGNCEQATSSDVLREECRQLGVLDPPNFVKALNGMKNWFNIAGSGKSKSLQIKPKGRDAFRQLLDGLLSDDGE